MIRAEDHTFIIRLCGAAHSSRIECDAENRRTSTDRYGSERHCLAHVNSERDEGDCKCDSNDDDGQQGTSGCSRVALQTSSPCGLISAPIGKDQMR